MSFFVNDNMIVDDYRLVNEFTITITLARQFIGITTYQKQFRLVLACTS